MIRIGSQLTFCTPEIILRRSAVELNEQNIVTGIFSLDDGNVETAHTLFYDGIISPGIVSLKQTGLLEGISAQIKNYDYYDFSVIPSEIIIQKTDKPLILDFGTNSTDKINTLLPFLTEALKAYSIFDIIAACTYFPALLTGMGQSTGLSINCSLGILLWENVDLTEKKLLGNTQIREIK